jgi:hypothetical protein
MVILWSFRLFWDIFWDIFWAMGYILWPFGKLHSGNLVYFSHFGVVCREKVGNPGLDRHLQGRDWWRRTFTTR